MSGSISIDDVNSQLKNVAISIKETSNDVSDALQASSVLASASVGETIGIAVDAAIERGRRARKTRKRANAKAKAHAKRLSKYAKKTKGEAVGTLSDIAEEVTARAGNVVAASQGVSVRSRHRTGWLIVGVGLAAVVAAAAAVKYRSRQQEAQPEPLVDDFSAG